MLTSFLAWTALGLLCRFALAHVLRVHFRRRWAIHPTAAGTIVGAGWVLAIYATLPLAPSLLPIPFGLIFGFFILDAVVVRL